MATQRSVLVLFAGSIFLLGGCGRSRQDDERAVNSAAEKAGKVAYSAAKETEKAAKVVGKKVAEAAHDAHKGWKEAAKEDKAKRD